MSTQHFVSLSTGAAITVFIAFVIISTSVSDACFIRNCPKGGKRSMDSTTVPRRECMKCGQDGLGQCVGSNICCGPNIGCLMGTKETEVCQQENQSLSPCFVVGDVCGAHDSGNCVADGYCCDSESCASNDRCRLSYSIAPQNQRTNTRNDILKMIQKLLQSGDYD